MTARRRTQRHSKSNSASFRKSYRRKPKKHARSWKASRARHRPPRRRNKLFDIPHNAKGAARAAPFHFRHAVTRLVHLAMTRPGTAAFILLERVRDNRVADVQSR